jgi:hypothetical protein
MDLQTIFSAYAGHEPNPSRPLTPLSPTFKTRLLMVLANWLSGDNDPYSRQDYTHEFWQAMHRTLQLRTGKPILSSPRRHYDQIADAQQYLLGCTDREFLAFVELIFRVDHYVDYFFLLPIQHDALINDINTLLREDDLPYYLTSFVRDEVSERTPHGTAATAIRIAQHPQIICREDEVIHAHAIVPVLHLLSQKGLGSANTEFLEALADYKAGDYGDCLIKCGSALESTLKLICNRRTWPYQETDTIGALLKIYFDHSTLDHFFEQPLLLVGTIRNRISKAHGAGAIVKSASPQVARYAINSTAAAILLLVEQEWQ